MLLLLILVELEHNMREAFNEVHFPRLNSFAWLELGGVLYRWHYRLNDAPFLLLTNHKQRNCEQLPYKGIQLAANASTGGGLVSSHSKSLYIPSECKEGLDLSDYPETTL